MKLLRAVGITLLCLPLPIILGTVGSLDLAIISSKQAMLQCGIALTLGVVGFVLMYITEHTPNNTESTLTPKANPYYKCCNCPHYADCCKSHSELLQCTESIIS